MLEPEAYKIERGIINEESEEEEVLEDIKEFIEDAKKQIKSNTTEAYKQGYQAFSSAIQENPYT